MSYFESNLPDFDQEMASTRKVLEVVPEDKLDWQPHPKSHTIGWNANHLADIPSWAVVTIKAPSFDINPPGGPPHETPKLTKRRELLDVFDKNVAEARAALATVKDDEMAKPWSLLSAGEPIFTLPRATMIRSYVVNHIIHHRAMLCAYYRLNDIPVPGMYGPSGDE